MSASADFYSHHCRCALTWCVYTFNGDYVPLQKSTTISLNWNCVTAATDRQTITHTHTHTHTHTNTHTHTHILSNSDMRFLTLWAVKKNRWAKESEITYKATVMREMSRWKTSTTDRSTVQNHSTERSRRHNVVKNHSTDRSSRQNLVQNHSTERSRKHNAVQNHVS